jgi:hypothetical protein
MAICLISCRVGLLERAMHFVPRVQGTIRSVFKGDFGLSEYYRNPI